jgi:hypothetical protein
MNPLNTNIGLEFAGSQEERKNEGNLKKYSVERRRKMRQNMERS